MSVDPSHFLPAANGGKPPLLKIQNVVARPELNGQFGQAVSFSAGRYTVAILDATTAASAVGGSTNDAQQPTFLKLKPDNLVEAGSIDQLKFGAGMVFQSAKAYIASPTMQSYGKQIIEKLPQAVQSKLTPNLALLGAAIALQSLLLLLWFIFGKVLGFTKVFTLLSLIALLLAVSSPDWAEGYKAKKPMKLIARSAAINFRRRWKDNLVQMTGYTAISDKMALASLVLVLLFSGKVLLTPAARPPRMPPMPMNGVAQPTATRGPPPPQYDLEYIYKLGFDDAKAENEFGTSLPDDIINYNAAQETPLPRPEDQYVNGGGTDTYDDWAYNPPPPKARPNLGMGTLFSMFTLYRFGKDLVTAPDGSVVLDPQYVMARVRSIEPWRLGMLGISLYRVISTLSAFFR